MYICFLKDKFVCSISRICVSKDEFVFSNIQMYYIILRVYVVFVFLKTNLCFIIDICVLKGKFAYINTNILTFKYSDLLFVRQICILSVGFVFLKTNLIFQIQRYCIKLSEYVVSRICVSKYKFVFLLTNMLVVVLFSIFVTTGGKDTYSFADLIGHLWR